MPAIRRAVSEIDPEIAIGSAQRLERLVETSVAARRYQMQLFVAFGLVALCIVTLGVYAVTSYGVSRRRREMNIRVALGGVVAGLLFDVQPHDPVVIGGVVAVVAVVTAVGALACFVAARRGLVIDPAAALREE